MGKGDKSSKRGKIFKGSYGNARPRTISPKAIQAARAASASAGVKPAARPAAAKAPAKAAPRKKA